MFNEIHEECGVFGIQCKETGDVGGYTYMALYALQHRGQESCGIAVNDDGVIKAHKDNGLVPDVFNKTVLDSLGMGNMALGHVRYGTKKNSNRINAQPLVIRHCKGNMALAYNGALTNAGILKEKLELSGGIFHTSSDTEVIAYTITKHRLTASSIEDAISKAMDEIEGAYSLVVMSPKKLIAVRDPNGFRPLCMGKIDGSVVFASETCALDSIGAQFVREILPGEIVVADENGVRSITTHCGRQSALCVFEFVYFARPDSVIDGQSVHLARQNAGAYLYREHPVEADVVIGVPDSGLDAALGFSKESGIPYGVGFIKNRYVGRTFIQPTQAMRENAVRIKLNALEATVKGKRVVLVDDSIVRGTTSKRIVQLLREAGATEVHMMISSPPFTNPCYFGTDIDGRDKLIACRMSIEEIRKSIGADTLGYLSIEAVKNIAKTNSGSFCTACFTGEYPVRIYGEKEDKFENKINSKTK